MRAGRGMPLRKKRKAKLAQGFLNGETCFLQAIVVEPSKDAPESVRRMMQPGKLCVMFYGPAANKVSTSFVSLPSRTCR